MQKLRTFLSSVNFIVLVFVLIGLRITVFGATIGDAIAILSICALKGFNNWLASKKQEPVNEKIQTELAELKSSVSSLILKTTVKPQTQAQGEPRRFF